MTKAMIHPPTTASLTTLAGIQGDDRCVLSVYFPGEWTRGRKAREKLSDLPAKLLAAELLTPDEEEHRRRSVDLWRRAVSKKSLPSAPGWIGVVSWLTNDAAFMRLPTEVNPAAYLDNSPFLLPAARQLDDFEPCAVVYADHARAAIYLAALGSLREEGRLRGDIKNHVRKGGWSQQRYERRRDKQIHHYCRALIGKLAELIEREDLRRVVLAGDRILLGELEERMPAAMRRQVVAHLGMEGNKDPREIYRETLSAAAEEEKREERWLRDAILGELGSGGRAVAGPDGTLEALRVNRVRRLLIGPMAGVEFWRCQGCGRSGLGAHPSCPGCRGATYPQSAPNEFMDLAFAADSRVELTGDDLRDLSGVGALLRW
jgi:hypothetical protein